MHSNLQSAVPKTATTFSSLGLPNQLLSNLFNMGFKEATPIQAGTIPGALQGRDVLGQAQTGTGKTGAFAVPMVNMMLADPNKKGLILAPTRELAAQIFKVLRQMCEETRIKGVLVVGGESFAAQERMMFRGANFIVATPGRLVDHLQRGRLGLKSIGMLVLDEVDRMVDMGFEPQLKEIMKHVPESRQTLLFSATLPKELMHLVNRYVSKPLNVQVGPVGVPVSNITERELNTTQGEKTNVLVNELNGLEGRVLVFTRTKSRADKLALQLQKQGMSVVKLHGGRSQAQRRFALQNFKTGNFRIMVATDVAGRGIDVDDIGAVINYDMPATKDDYVHRIGRTGRYGKPGQAINFITPEENSIKRRTQAATQKHAQSQKPNRPGQGYGQRKPFGGRSGSPRNRFAKRGRS